MYIYEVFRSNRSGEYRRVGAFRDVNKARDLADRVASSMMVNMPLHAWRSPYAAVYSIEILWDDTDDTYEGDDRYGLVYVEKVEVN